MTTGTIARSPIRLSTHTNEAGRRIRKLFAFVTIGGTHAATLVAFVVAASYGVHPGHLVVAAALFVLTAAIGVEIGYHRLFAHHAFDTGPIVRSVFAVLGSMAGQGSVVFWAGVHRVHHAHTDTVGDPHSPHLHQGGFWGKLGGIWHAHVGWLFTGQDYNACGNAGNLLRDPVVYGVSRRYIQWVLVGLAIPTLIGALIERSAFGALQGLLWGGFVRTFAGQHFVWGVNSIGHVLGPRGFASQDHSRNSRLLALPSFGGSLHNNHHAFPSAASTSRYWWELDPSGWIIHLLVALKLASNPKRPSDRAVLKLALARSAGSTPDGR